MRIAKPWYRAQTDAWYVCLAGKQVKLATGKKNKRQAHQALARLVTDEARDGHGGDGSALLGDRVCVAVVLDEFLEWAQQNLASYAWYKRFLQDFATSCGGLRVTALKRSHVTKWLSGKSWNETTRNKVIGAVMRPFNWAATEGLIAQNPIRGMARPAAKRRERILTAEEKKLIYSSVKDQAFRDFLTAIEETGARPKEIRTVTASQVDLNAGVWILSQHKTAKKTGKARTIYLTPVMVDITRRLVSTHPDGPIFRNRLGKPWTLNAVRIRFRRLRKKYPQLLDVVSYCYRHSFATDGLVNGTDVVAMAELLGHGSTEMLSKHYSHLGQKGDYLKKSLLIARRASGVEGASGPPAP